jgi:hypothetical protein
MRFMPLMRNHLARRHPRDRPRKHRRRVDVFADLAAAGELVDR